MTTMLTFEAGVALVRDLFVLAVFAVAGMPVINSVATIMGKQIPFDANGQMWMGMVQPSFLLFYVVIVLAGIARIAWFFLVSIQRVDYAEAM